MTVPNLAVERALLGRTGCVIGVDEVGRGAIAGPLAVGACAVTAASLEQDAPAGLRDSKLLTPARREALAPDVASWAFATGIGWASAAEIDEFGITQCLAAAAMRALASLWEQGVPVDTAAVLLDGSHDWLSPLLSAPLDVTVRAKADRDCTSVAAASVIAKVARDARMRELSASFPAYDWAKNKGYGSAAHRDAVREHGPCAEHRHTWLGRILTTSG